MHDFKSAQIDLPENDDNIFCPECFLGTDLGGGECSYCDGTGEVSERHYNDLKSLGCEEYNL